MDIFNLIQNEELLNIQENIFKFDFSKRNSAGNTALHEAVRLGNYDIIDLLVQYIDDINCKNLNGDTPMHLAVELGDYEIVSLLLDYNANPNIENNNRVTPKKLAILQKKESIYQLLINEDFYNFEEIKHKKHFDDEYSY
ncbi:ankyrin repeat protein [Hypnocyclicus thermotrophus]|uniref:Ankyrin repeat protein n=1 Tax=Hypnocyclicus thermotrophus TaxID=1627895 RepID=A0AA46E024_9FUSO|nr:ankyrin repeat domain-containing protein [Hypnocyclicus thermotrophus]TDT72292.1 ankyrin repeat protein [Hypnocyclicus thermotrophus]